jgi:PST family polysaccharide transporter
MDGASGAPLYLAERDLQFPFLTRARTLINAVGFVACVGLALAGWGVGALVADRVLGAALMAGVVWRRTGWKAALAWDGESLRYLLRFGGWLLAGAMVGKLLFGLDAMALGTFWGEEALGYYSRAMVWARLPLDVGVGFLAMMALAIYSSESRASGEAARRSYADLSGHVARISLAMAGLLAIGMHDAVPVLFGERWRPITPMFYALVPYAVARPLFQNAAQCLLSLHEQRYFVGAVVASTAVLGAGIALSVGRSPLWVAAANGAAMLLGYVLLERRVERRLAPRAWASAATPAALFAAAMLALAACRRLGPEGAAGLALAAALAAAYALAAWWEWRRWGSLQSSKAAA